MTAWIRSIGTALPVHSIAQPDAALLVQELGITHRWLDALPALYRKSGVKRRGSVLLLNSEPGHCGRQTFYPKAAVAPCGPTTAERMVEYDRHSKGMLEAACRDSLLISGIPASCVTHLVTVSCTGFSAPGVDHAVIDRLGLSLSTQRFHIGFMGCHGLINGLRVAHGIVKSDPDSTVLVGAVELCSLHQQYTDDPQQLVANALFADGAASVVVTGDRSIAVDTNPQWRIVSSLSWLIPGTTSHMSWSIRDHGYEMKLSPEVPSIIEAHLREPVVRWLDGVGLQWDDIDSWAIHPGGPRILDAVGSTFQLDDSKLQPSRDTLAEFGNMSSPTVLFVLKRLSQTASRRCLLVAFGPGLHAELILLERSQS